MTSGPNRALAVLAGVVVLLAVVAGVVASRREATVLDRGTPEGVTQAYLQAVLDDDLAAAAALLAPRSGCAMDDVAQSHLPDAVRVVLESATVDADTAVVTLGVTDVYGGGPFDSSEYSHTERVTLARDGGAWLVTGSAWLLPTCGPAKG